MEKHIPADKAHILFLLCWTAYFAANLGRLNYGAAMAEIIAAEGFSNAAAGLVSTGFFISYGAGQLLSGYIGDFAPPKWMVLFGVAGSALCNLAMSLLSAPEHMLAAWCVNGLMQAAIWTPILRIIAELFPIRYRHRACVNMATTYPAAALVTYIGGAGLVLLTGWRGVFRVCAALMLAAAALWVVGFGRMERRLVPVGEETGGEARPEEAQGEAREAPPFPLLLLGIICLALVFQGILRDGVMTWVPAYLSGTFGVGVAFSIFSTALLPVVNLAGVWAAGRLHRKNHNELLTAALLFGVAAAAALALFLLGRRGLALSLFSFSLITSGMMGVNLMLVSFVPTYFSRWGKVSFVAGLVNAMVYVGSSLATYGIGAVADALGWGVLLFLLLLAALAGGALCFACIRRWRIFARS